jgi:anti-anti-sigma factor
MDGEVPARLSLKVSSTVEPSPPSPLQIDVCWNGVVATVTVSGELDAATASSLTERLLTVAQARPERLVLDLGGLVFVDVAGVRALDGAHKALQARCPVILRGPRPAARTASWLTGLTQG